MSATPSPIGQLSADIAKKGIRASEDITKKRSEFGRILQRRDQSLGEYYKEEIRVWEVCWQCWFFRSEPVTSVRTAATGAQARV
jgi:hypothetical protein